MLTRFQGPNGQRRLRDELARQTVVEHQLTVAESLADSACLLTFDKGDMLIVQGAADSHIDFILTGEVKIEVSGKEVARRKAGTHVGELALIDPSAPRSATVRATEPTVVARVEEVAFTPIAQAHPSLWRAIARDVGTRLRERGKLVRPKNERPHVFVGCSTEALDLAREFQVAFQYDPFVVRLWTDDIFVASHHASEDLLTITEAQDFAILIATADDAATMRGATRPVPRDNVIFELGLFFGAIGRDRTILVQTRGTDLKLPSDFLGLTPVDVAAGDPTSLAIRVGPAATIIRKQIIRLGPR